MDSNYRIDNRGVYEIKSLNDVFCTIQYSDESFTRMVFLHDTINDPIISKEIFESEGYQLLLKLGE